MPRRPPQPGLLSTIVSAALLSPSVIADEIVQECPHDAALFASRSPARATPSDSDGPIMIFADHSRTQLERVSVFSGHVSVRRDGTSILADEVIYNHQENRLDAKGDIRITTDAGHVIDAPVLQYRLNNEAGYSESADFSLSNGRARGEANRIWFDGSERLVFDRIRYTTCPHGQNDWFLKANRLKLDRESGLGTARGVVLEFMHVPFFYSPYFSFPITDQRQSGFLIPRFGFTDNQGFVLAAPYYWNIAPNFDDTITPRYMSRRGLQIQNEFRYLSSNLSGTADLEYLPNDKLFKDDRAAARWRHAQSLSTRWSTSADLSWLSDGSYLTDLGESTATTSASHVPRLAELRYSDERVRFLGRTQYYQTLDAGIPADDRPYGRMPQLILDAEVPGTPNRPSYRLESEWVNFTRGGISDNRFDITPSISMPWRNSYAFLIPKFAGRYTTYQLEDTATRDVPDKTPERYLSIFSVDSGLLFERDWDYNQRSLIQTLEPRIYYLHVPYENQDSLPLYDTGIPDFSFYNLFRENRFIGADRIGDSKQLTVALSTRFLERDSGIEQVRLSLGQTLYFRDRRVNIPAGENNDNSSDTVAEVYARLADPWYLRSGVQWNPRENSTEKGNVLLQYHPDEKRILNLSYRFIDNLQRQTDVSAQWPLGRRWTGLARWNYSLRHERTLQAYAGVEFNNCCWALRVVARQRVLPNNTPEGKVDKGIIVELELTGLGKLGVAPETPVSQGAFIFDDLQAPLGSKR